MHIGTRLVGSGSSCSRVRAIRSNQRADAQNTLPIVSADSTSVVFQPRSQQQSSYPLCSRSNAAVALQPATGLATTTPGGRGSNVVSCIQPCSYLYIALLVTTLFSALHPACTNSVTLILY